MKKTLLILFSFLLVAAAYPPGFKGMEDFNVEVSKRNVIGNEIRDVIGETGTMTTNTEQTVWGSAAIIGFPSAATIMSVSSDNGADTSGGTGARLIALRYLDSNYEEQVTSFLTDGATGTVGTAVILRIRDMVAASAGSTETNQGNIYLGTGTISAGGIPATIFHIIRAGDGLAKTATFTVPKDRNLLVKTVTLSSSGIVSVWPESRSSGSTIWIEGAAMNANRGAHTFETSGLLFSAGADIRWQALSNEANAEATVEAIYYLINNGDTGRID